MDGENQAHMRNSAAAYGQAGAVAPLRAELAYLRRGLDQPGGKLPLFDRRGQEVDAATVHVCLAKGWAEPWFSNPVKPDWLVCRLTPAGRALLEHFQPSRSHWTP